MSEITIFNEIPEKNWRFTFYVIKLYKIGKIT
jgi:hypothetical protein